MKTGIEIKSTSCLLGLLGIALLAGCGRGDTVVVPALEEHGQAFSVKGKVTTDLAAQVPCDDCRVVVAKLGHEGEIAEIVSHVSITGADGHYHISDVPVDKNLVIFAGWELFVSPGNKDCTGASKPGPGAMFWKVVRVINFHGDISEEPYDYDLGVASTLAYQAFVEIAENLNTNTEYQHITGAKFEGSSAKTAVHELTTFLLEDADQDSVHNLGELVPFVANEAYDVNGDGDMADPYETMNIGADMLFTKCVGGADKTYTVNPVIWYPDYRAHAFEEIEEIVEGDATLAAAVGLEDGRDYDNYWEAAKLFVRVLKQGAAVEGAYVVPQRLYTARAKKFHQASPGTTDHHGEVEIEEVPGKAGEFYEVQVYESEAEYNEGHSPIYRKAVRVWPGIFTEVAFDTQATAEATGVHADAHRQ